MRQHTLYIHDLCMTWHIGILFHMDMFVGFSTFKLFKCKMDDDFLKCYQR